MGNTKAQASTQSFTEILDIRENILLFTNNNASVVLEVHSTNFSLLSKEEQDAKITGFSGFLNSLTFPIQILVNNRRVDISAYTNMLEGEIHHIQNQLVKEYMEHYKNFIKQLVKDNIVLDKKFYIAVSFSSLETGSTSALIHTTADDLFTQAKPTLLAKAEGISTQLQRLRLQTTLLGKDELIALFHELYNPQETQISTVQPKGVS